MGLTHTKTVAELSEIADKHLQETWDPDQPLYRWLRAIKHLANEAKSYDKDGSAELALIRLMTVNKLVTEILPTHPEWYQLPDRNIQTVKAEAAALIPTTNKLKQQIYAASDTNPIPSFSNLTTLVAPGTSTTPPLTLRHTVQPASDSMSLSSPYSSTAPPPPQAKLRASDKLKKKLGLGKKPLSSSLAPPTGDVPRPGSAPPSSGSSVGWSVAEKAEERDSAGEEGWMVVDQRLEEGASLLERPRSRVSSAATGGSVASAPEADRYGQRPPPPPGPARLASYPAQSSSRTQERGMTEWESRRSTPTENLSSPAGRERIGPMGDQPGIAYARIGAPAWDAVPVRTSYASSSQPTSTYNSSAPPSRASTSDTSYMSQPPSAYLDTRSNTYDETIYSLPGAVGIQRTPSRLTTIHQNQQGFYPSLRRAGRGSGRGGQGPDLPDSQAPGQRTFGYSLGDYAANSSPEVSTSSEPMVYSNSVPPPRQQPTRQYPPTTPSAMQPQQQQLYPQHSSRPLAYSSPSYTGSGSPTKPLRPLPSTPLERPKPPPTPNSFARANPAYPQPSDRRPVIPPLLAHRHEPRPPPLSSSALDPSRLTRSGSVSAMPFLPSERSERGVLATTEDGLPLRNVVVPAGLIPEFVKRAHDNTKRGIETCGLLMGTLGRNTFTISHLLIPKQQGTVDTCTTTHEEEQFEFQDKHDLLVVGWIHTHPQFSCFMSSLDLHTHASYQSMLAEAIAIVCSPNADPGEPEFGVFRLTSPVGIQTIVECRQPGAFHPHPDLPIYTDSDPRYGHARMRDLPFETVDLRKKSRW